MMLTTFLAGCGPKKPINTVIVGWWQEETWSLACYHPPDYEKLNRTERDVARQKSMDSMLNQWQGNRNDGVSVDGDTVEDIETVLLGRPEKIEELSRENLSQCKQVATGATSLDAWVTWVGGLSSKLMAGECSTPLIDTIFDYLNITTGFDRSFPICEGNRIRISGTTKDQYRIVEDGDWITVEGNTNQPSVGSELPCNIEGCFAGQLIMKFTSEEGVETVIPVGASVEFTAPNHGTISYTINDDTYFDNNWYKSGGISDHASIEISPTQ
jgi:hypothetical protein